MVVRNYYRRPEDLEPGQLIYLCPAADERQRKGKTMAHTRLVPVRLTVVAQGDIDAMVAGVGALERRELRVRRLAHEAYDQGGVLSELDLSLVTGYTDGGVSATVIRLRKRGEMLRRGYVADMGSWPTHKAAIIRLYLEGLTTPEIASRTYHAKKSVDRYIEGFERVRLLAAKHPREELPLLTGHGPQRRRPIPGHLGRAPTRPTRPPPPKGAKPWLNTHQGCQRRPEGPSRRDRSEAQTLDNPTTRQRPQWTTPRPPGGDYKATAPHEVRLIRNYSVVPFGAATARTRNRSTPSARLSTEGDFVHLPPKGRSATWMGFGTVR